MHHIHFIYIHILYDYTVRIYIFNASKPTADWHNEDSNSNCNVYLYSYVFVGPYEMKSAFWRERAHKRKEEEEGNCRREKEWANERTKRMEERDIQQMVLLMRHICVYIYSYYDNNEWMMIIMIIIESYVYHMQQYIHMDDNSRIWSSVFGAVHAQEETWYRWRNGFFHWSYLRILRCMK